MHSFRSATFVSLVLPWVVLAGWPFEYAIIRRTTMTHYDHFSERQLQSFPAITLAKFNNEVNQICANPGSSMANPAVEAAIVDIGIDTVNMQNSFNEVAQQVAENQQYTVATRWSLIGQQWATILGISSNTASNIVKNMQQFTSVQLPNIISLVNSTQPLGAVAILETFSTTLTTLTQQAETTFDNLVLVQGTLGTFSNTANSTGTPVSSTIATIENYFYNFLVIWGAVLNDNKANIETLNVITSGAIQADDIWSAIAGVACVCEVVTPYMQEYASATMNALI